MLKCVYITILTGEKDDQGYYEAEVNGQKGLVPASYLLPLPIDKDILRSMVERRQQQLQVICNDHSEQRIF